MATPTLAQDAGIHSLAAAILFAILYVPFAALYLRQFIRRPAFLFFILMSFCLIRIIAFSIRADLAGSQSAGQNLTLLLVDQILYGVGFFGVLFSTYSIVLDRSRMNGYVSNSPLIRITSNRVLFHLALTAAVVVGIIGSIDQFSSTTTASKLSLGKTLRTASTAIFLVLTVITALHTALLANDELNSNRRDYEKDESFGKSHGAYILCVVIALLLVREIFLIATIGDFKKQTQESLYYPFSATTEFLAIALLAAPGLIPSKSEMPPSDESGFLLTGLYNRYRQR